MDKDAIPFTPGVYPYSTESARREMDVERRLAHLSDRIGVNLTLQIYGEGWEPYHYRIAEIIMPHYGERHVFGAARQSLEEIERQLQVMSVTVDLMSRERTDEENEPAGSNTNE